MNSNVHQSFLIIEIIVQDFKYSFYLKDSSFTYTEFFIQIPIHYIYQKWIAAGMAGKLITTIYKFRN